MEDLIGRRKKEHLRIDRVPELKNESYGRETAREESQAFGRPVWEEREAEVVVRR